MDLCADLWQSDGETIHGIAVDRGHAARDTHSLRGYVTPALVGRRAALRLRLFLPVSLNPSSLARSAIAIGPMYPSWIEARRAAEPSSEAIAVSFVRARGERAPRWHRAHDAESNPESVRHIFGMCRSRMMRSTPYTSGGKSHRRSRATPPLHSWISRALTRLCPRSIRA